MGGKYFFYFLLTLKDIITNLSFISEISLLFNAFSSSWRLQV